MKTRHILTGLVALSLSVVLTTATANSQSWADGLPVACKVQLKALKKMKGWKAFAISNVVQLKNGPKQGCGWAQGYGTKSAATRVALYQCRTELKELGAAKTETCNVRFSAK